MKIMILTGECPSENSFRGIRVFEFAKTFSSSKNNDVKILFYDLGSKSKYSVTNIDIQKNLKLKKIQGRRFLPRIFVLGWMINSFSIPLYTRLVIEETREYNPDIIITVVPSFIPTISTFIATKIIKVKYCIDVKDNWLRSDILDYDYDYLHKYIKLIFKVMHKLNYKLFTVSCKSALLISTVYDNMINDLCLISNNKVPVIFIPNGINMEELRNVNSTFNKKAVFEKNGFEHKINEMFVIFVGNIGELYKPEILLDPLKQLIDSGFKINYILIGDGKSKDIIREKLKQMHLENNVFLLGIKNHQDVLELMLASDLAFYALDKKFPFQENALGTKVLEYIACKLPILSISTTNNNVYKLVSEKKIGIALNWDEESKILESIKELIEDNKAYINNINRYYIEFSNIYDRNISNNRLYNEICKYYNKNS